MARSAFGLFLVGLFGLTAVAKEAIPIKIAYPRPGSAPRSRSRRRPPARPSTPSRGCTRRTKDEVKTKSFIYTDEVIENPKNAKRNETEADLREGRGWHGGKDKAVCPSKGRPC